MRLTIGLYRFQFRTIAVVVALIAIALCSHLGFWQLSRAEHKEQRLAQIADYQQYDKLALKDLLKISEEHDPTGITIELQGMFLKDFSWLLDNRTVKGQPGYDALLAFRPQNQGAAVIINMGWLKGNYAKRDELPAFSIPQGPIKIKGFVRGGKLTQFVLSEQTEGEQWPKRVPQVDLELFAKQSHLELLPFVIYAEPGDYGFVHHYQPVVMGPEKHRAYALQWFLLALAALVIFIFASKEQKIRHQENKDDRP